MLAGLTFPLAAVGFVLLAVSAGLAAKKNCPRWLTLLTAAVIITHVLFVWSFRYGWSFATATRNGYVGFALFHAALLLVVLAPAFSAGRTQRWLLIAAFLIVCIGANGAVYRYDEITAYRIPVHVITLAGPILLWQGRQRRAS